MKITFVLPGLPPVPQGGPTIVYRYAEELAARGHAVTVVHCRIPSAPIGLHDWLKSLAWRGRRFYRSRSGRPKWYRLDPAVRSVVARTLRVRSVPEGDAVIATSCETATPVASLPAESGTKYYLIQGYEDWVMDPAVLEDTWRLPMSKIVISRWLLEIAERLGECERTTYIPNGIDLAEFPLVDPPEERKPGSIGLLGHALTHKGTAVGVAAVEALRSEFRDITLTVVGTGERSADLPSWVEYVRNPSRPELARLYNSFALFVHPSTSEGFGLTPAEAMLSGCTVVGYANCGIKEYATNEETALLVPVGDRAALTAAIRRAMTDDQLRYRLARAGRRAVSSLTWERAVDAFESVLTDNVDRSTSLPMRH